MVSLIEFCPVPNWEKCGGLALEKVDFKARSKAFPPIITAIRDALVIVGGYVLITAVGHKSAYFIIYVQKYRILKIFWTFLIRFLDFMSNPIVKCIL